MSGPAYTLCFRNVEVGTIRRTDADFPNLWGTFSVSPQTSDLETRELVHRYIAYSREADRLMQEGDATGDAYDEHVARNEPQFIDLIECGDWCLVDASGTSLPILVPIFCIDGVVWRWNVRGLA